MRLITVKDSQRAESDLKYLMDINERETSKDEAKYRLRSLLRILSTPDAAEYYLCILEGRMKDDGTPDYDDAVTRLEKPTPPPKRTSGSSGTSRLAPGI